MNLSHLTDEEFADEVNESLFNDELFAPLKDLAVAERTKVELMKLQADLNSQIVRFQHERDQSWNGRVRAVLHKVKGRLYEVTVVVKDANRDRTASVDAIEAKWSKFAHDLAEALDDSDMGFMLDEILLPPGEITAGEWLDRRREQRAGKRAKALV